MRWLGFLLVFCAFTYTGILMIRDEKAAGWLCAIFFGLGIPISILQLLPGSSYLKLDKDGFTFSSMYRPKKIAWKDVLEFGTYRPPRAAEMVGFTLRTDSQTAGHRLSAGLSGWHGGLPDTYGRSAKDLAELLEDWRKKHSV